MTKWKFDLRFHWDKFLHLTWGFLLFFYFDLVFRFFNSYSVIAVLSVWCLYEIYVFLKLNKFEASNNYIRMLLIGIIVLTIGFIIITIFWYNPILSVLFVSIMGYYKEVADAHYSYMHTADYGDTIYTIIGGVLGIIILLLI